MGVLAPGTTTSRFIYNKPDSNPLAISPNESEEQLSRKRLALDLVFEQRNDRIGTKSHQFQIRQTSEGRKLSFDRLAEASRRVKKGSEET